MWMVVGIRPKTALFPLQVFIGYAFLTGNQSQLNLEHSKSRMGTFVEGGPMSDTNPDEGYKNYIINYRFLVGSVLSLFY